MSPAWEALNATMAGFPRVSGDEPVLIGALRFLVVFSPRERG